MSRERTSHVGRPPCPSATVCHVTTVHDPFDTRVFRRECTALAEAGYDVRLLAVHEGDCTRDGVRLHGLPRPPSRLARIARWPWRAYERILAIRPRPALCHLHDPELLAIAPLLRLAGFRVVFDVHENIPEQILAKHYLPMAVRLPVAWAYRFAEAVLTAGVATVHVLDGIAARYRPPKAVVRNLPRLQDVPEPPPAAARPGPVRLVYVGGISAQRGAREMVLLAAELQRRGLDFELRVVGPVIEPGLTDEMRRIARQAGLGDRLRLTGPLPYEQARADLAAADIGLCLFLPVRHHLRSLPNKILEYLASGLAVVASDLPCWREFVTDTGAGIQVDPTDTAAAADACQRLIEHPDLRRAMAERARRAARERYNWDAEKPRLLDFYGQLLRR